MSGLRRVTLNRNPLIADRGATFLAEVLEADLWIKGKRVFLLHLLLFNDQSQLTDEYLYIYIQHIIPATYILCTHAFICIQIGCIVAVSSLYIYKV